MVVVVGVRVAHFFFLFPIFPLVLTSVKTDWLISDVTTPIKGLINIMKQMDLTKSTPKE